MTLSSHLDLSLYKGFYSSPSSYSIDFPTVPVFPVFSFMLFFLEFSSFLFLLIFPTK